MSFKLIRLASELEQSDDLHEARLLLLLGAATDYHTTKPVDGIMRTFFSAIPTFSPVFWNVSANRSRD
jgi:hypothetical protein